MIDFNLLMGYLFIIGYKALIFFVILLAGWVVGRVVGIIIGKVVLVVGADSVLRKTILGRAIVKSGYTVSDFFKALSKWIIYLSALLIAFMSLNVPYIDAPVQTVLSFMPKLITAILIFVIGVTVSDWAGELVKRGFTQEQKQAFYLDILSNFLKATLYFIVITITLSQLGVDVTILYTIVQAFAWGFAIVMAVVVGIIVGWILKDKVREVLPV